MLPLQALFLGATAIGGLIGGWVGDRAAMHYANHGRIFVVQFSVSMGPIFSVLLLKVRNLLTSIPKPKVMCQVSNS